MDRDDHCEQEERWKKNRESIIQKIDGKEKERARSDKYAIQKQEDDEDGEQDNANGEQHVKGQRIKSRVIIKTIEVVRGLSIKGRILPILTQYAQRLPICISWTSKVGH